jgi:hypothetical protein
VTDASARRLLTGRFVTAAAFVWQAERGGVMKALVSWEDERGTTHRWQLAYDEDDAEARSFLEGIELHVRFRLESFDVDSDAAAPDS